MKFSRTNILYIVLALVLLGGGIYYFLFFNKDTGSALTTTDAASDQEQSFLTLVDQLGPITFDTSLLSDPRFTTRTDIRTTILPEATGRTDPFAPIAGVAPSK